MPIMSSIGQDDSQVNALEMQAMRTGAYVSLTSLALLLYDHSLTISDEIDYFWSGPWSISRLLFFVNRYLAPTVQILNVMGFLGPELSPNTCSKLVPTTSYLAIVTLVVVQGIIVLRIWYLYSRRKAARLCVVCIYIACTAVSIVQTAMVTSAFASTLAAMPKLRSGCAIPLSYDMWKVYAPNLILHTVLFMATAWPAVQMSGRGTNAPLLFRLTQDGGVFYIMVFGAAIWATAGSVQNKDEAVMLSATYSDLIMSVPSVCVSRLMFSIHSLAAALDTDADTLLSAAELSRVRWRRGLHPGEIFVDIESVEDERAQYPRDTYVGTFELDQLSTHRIRT